MKLSTLPKKFKIFKLTIILLQIVLLLYSSLPQLPIVMAQENSATVSAQQSDNIGQSPTPSPSITSPSPTSILLSPSPSSTLPSPTSPPPLASPSPQISSSFLSPSFMPSALMRQKMAILPLEKKTYQARETVRIKVINLYDERTTISIRNKNGEELPVVVDKETIGEETHLKLFPPANFKPGRYRLTIIDSSGNSFEQNFDWGVLAINTNKSIYLPDDQAKIAIAVLDEGGAPVCGAYVKLEISTPSGNTTTLGTWDRVIRQSPQCGIREVTYVPDYETEYAIGNELGVYNMKLTAETKNGVYSIEDFFEVRKDVLFDVERVSATRIFPLHEYSSGFNITSNIDFEGTIVETVPENFAVKPFNDGRVITYDRIATVSASIGKGMVLGAQTAGRLSLPFSGLFPITLRYGEDPDDARLSAKYRRFGLNSHDAVDFAMSEGTPLLAVDDGEVLLAGDGLYGITVILKHAWGKSYYGHLSQPSVDIGQKVSKGEIIGLSGNTGLSTGPHLHFAILPEKPDFDNGYFGKVDPLSYLQLNSQGRPTQVAGASTSIFNVKEIVWNLKIKKGEKVTIGYLFDAPDLSPQFYLLGPLKFFSNQPVPSATISPMPTLTTSADATNISTPSSNLSTPSSITSSPPSISPSPTPPTGGQTSTTSATLVNNQPSQQLPITSPPPTSGNLIFQEARRWQIAADADITIDETSANNYVRHKLDTRLVFINDQVGYVFYVDANGSTCGYKKTTDGGATWDADITSISGGCIQIAAWYDQWTRGDTTNDLIHLNFWDSNNHVTYTTLDPTNDTKGSNAIVQDIGSNTSFGNPGVTQYGITKATNGTLFISYIGNSTTVGNNIEKCSSNCTTASNWTNAGTASPHDSQWDYSVIAPTADVNNPVMIIRQDLSANDLDYSLYNNTNWTDWVDIETNIVEQNSNNMLPFGYVVRRYDSNLYLAAVDNPGTNDTANIRSYVYNGSSWTNQTDILSAADLASNRTVVDVGLGVDEETGDIYAFYNFGVDLNNTDIVYKVSSDGMNTWGSQTNASTSNTNGDNHQVMANYVSSDRIYFVYWSQNSSGTNDGLFGATLKDLTPPQVELLKHGDWFSKAGKRREFTF